jgi:hypothetical protein
MTDTTPVGSCNVTVSNANNKITVNTQNIDPTGAGTLQFNLRGRPGYKFLAASPFGVVVQPATPPATAPSVEFTNYVRVSDTEVTLYDNDNNNANYPFTVTVEDSNGTTYTSDPAIRNRGGGG